MSTVIQFDASRRRPPAADFPGDKVQLVGPVVVILPVVRIERHGPEVQVSAPSARAAPGASCKGH